MTNSYRAPNRHRRWAIVAVAILALAAVGSFVFTQSPWAQDVKPAKPADESQSSKKSPSSKPSILWTPDHLNIDGNDTVSVTLSAQSPIPATQVEIVPSLAPYISVSPEALPALAKGATQILQIAAKVPAGTPMNTLDGTLHLRSGRSTIARPLPIKLDLWPSISVGPVLLRYPPELVAESDGNGVLLSWHRDENENEGVFIYAITVHNPEGLSVADFFDGDPGNDLMGRSNGEYSQILVAGRTAYKFVPFETFAGEVTVVVPLEGMFMKITDQGLGFQENGLFAAILETINFP